MSLRRAQHASAAEQFDRSDPVPGTRLSRYSSLRTFNMGPATAGDRLAQKRMEAFRGPLTAAGETLLGSSAVEGASREAEERKDGVDDAADRGLHPMVVAQRREYRSSAHAMRDRGLRPPRDFQADEVGLVRARREAEARGESFWSVERRPRSPNPELAPEPEGVTRARHVGPTGVEAVLKEMEPRPPREGVPETDDERIERIAFAKARAKVLKNLGGARHASGGPQYPHLVDHVWGLCQFSSASDKGLVSEVHSAFINSDLLLREARDRDIEFCRKRTEFGDYVRASLLAKGMMGGKK
jgi:hypothetical protein